MLYLRFPHRFIVASFATITLMVSVPASAADVVIGVPNWTSAEVTGHVFKTIMEQNLGIDAEVRKGTNAVIWAGMASGSMHAHTEVWLPNQQNLFDKYAGDVRINPNWVSSDNLICVTKATADKHGVRSIYDLTNPDNAVLFDTDGDGQGEMWIGAAGWNSSNIEKTRAKSYGYDETMELLLLDESVALARLDAAAKRNKPYVTYCYRPHTMFSLYDLVVLKEPAHNPAKWKPVQPTDDPNWLENSEAGVAWPPVKIHVVRARSLEKSQPDAASLLVNAKFSVEILEGWIYQVEVEKRGFAEVASKWVSDNSRLVESWLGQ